MQTVSEHPRRLQLPTSSLLRYRIPSHVPLHWNISIGDGMALYTGDSRDPVFRGWLKKSTPITFQLSNICGPTGGFWCNYLPPDLRTTVLIRKGTSGMGQRVGRL